MANQNKSKLQYLPAVVSLFIVCLAITDRWSAFHPTGGNWGFHSMAFYGIGVRIAVPLLMLLLAIPVVQIRLVRWIQFSVEWFSKLNRRTKFALAGGFLIGAVLLFWFFRERSYFLGDGYLCLRNLPSVSETGELTFAYKHEPLVGWIMLQFYNLFHSLGCAMPELCAYQVISMVSGIGFIVIGWNISRYFSEDITDRFLILVLLLVGGSSQLFFGYAENYSLTSSAMLLFLLVGMAYLRGTGAVAWPVLTFGFLLTLHFGLLVFLPLLGMLGLVAIRRKQLAEFGASLFLMSAMALLLFWFSGYELNLLPRIFFDGSSFILPIVGLLGKNQAYHLFSLNHFIDLVNFLFLGFPGITILLLISLFFGWKKVKSLTLEALFLLIAAVCGGAFICLINCKLGMSRDWDLLIPFAVGIPATALALSMMVYTDRLLRHRIFIVLGAAALLHSAPFIGVNADKEWALARFNTLQDGRFWNTQAKLDAHEELAIYYRAIGDYSQAIHFYKKYIALDSTNWRLWGNLAETYHKAGDAAKALHTYKTMILAGMVNSDILMNCGMVFAGQRHFTEAFALLIDAEALAPDAPLIKCNLGVVVLDSEQNYTKALSYFLAAIQLDSTFSGAYNNAAVCYLALGDTAMAGKYLMLSQKFKR
jgi:tetratricopeptide (TPR) repeat protein